MSRWVTPLRTAAGYGRIASIGSTTGTVNAMPGQSTYTAAKAGLVGFAGTGPGGRRKRRHRESRCTRLYRHRFTVTVRSRRRGGGTDRAQWHAGGDRRVRALPRPRVGLVCTRDGTGRRRRPRSAGDLATTLSSPPHAAGG